MKNNKRSRTFVAGIVLVLICAPLIYAKTVPSAPDGFYGWFEPEGEYVVLKWGRNPGGEGVDFYEVQRCDGLDPGPFYTIDNKIPDPGSGTYVYYNDYTVDPEEYDYWQYHVRAHNSSGWGDYCQHEIVPVYPEKK